jgi:hypothetical protein
LLKKSNGKENSQLRGNKKTILNGLIATFPEQIYYYLEV